MKNVSFLGLSVMICRIISWSVFFLFSTSSLILINLVSLISDWGWSCKYRGLIYFDVDSFLFLRSILKIMLFEIKWRLWESCEILDLLFKTCYDDVGLDFIAGLVSKWSNTILFIFVRRIKTCSVIALVRFLLWLYSK